jgi:type IV pilus assembly protein PilW
MVALVVSLMVVAALFSVFFATSINSKHGQAIAQVTEDANLALNMLRGALVQVGYSRAIGTSGNTLSRAYTPGDGRNGLMGCDNGFVTTASPTLGALSCVAGNGNDALAVAYEADAFNSVSSGSNVPYDCLGNALTKVGVSPNQYYLNYSRYFLDTMAGTRKALFCRGDPANGAQALVENIEDMQILYGVSSDLLAGQVQPAYYATASTLAGSFANVVSVRICLIVASTHAVMDKDANGHWRAYRNCNLTAPLTTTPNDGRMYRAFTSTVVLQNRLGVIG